MANMIFNTYNEIAEYMINCDEKDLLVSALAYVDEATEIIRSLLMYDIGVGCVEISHGYIDGYSEEYLISVVGSKLFVEKAFDIEKQKYINDESDLLLVCDDCGYESDDSGICAHYIVLEECCCDDCDECHEHSGECCDCEECETEKLPTYRIIDDDGNVIGTANITVDIEIED